MPFNKEQIKIVNQSLMASAFTDARFSGSLINDIAYDIITTDNETKTIAPGEYDENGDGQLIDFSQNVPLTIYHKVTSTNYQINKEQYGRGNKYLVQEMNCYLIAYAKAPLIKLTPDQLETLLIVGLPDIVTNNLPQGIDNLTLTPIRSSTNQLENFNGEFKNIEFFLSQEDILIKVNYSLVSRFKKDCIAICCT